MIDLTQFKANVEYTEADLVKDFENDKVFWDNYEAQLIKEAQQEVVMLKILNNDL